MLDRSRAWCYRFDHDCFNYIFLKTQQRLFEMRGSLSIPQRDSLVDVSCRGMREKKDTCTLANLNVMSCCVKE